jgi:hypothetical protein
MMHQFQCKITHKVACISAAEEMDNGGLEEK